MPSLPPILSGSLPSTLPGPHPVGYASLRHPAASPYTLPAPLIPSGPSKGKEVFGVREVGYAVYYPCVEGKAGWWGGWRRGVGWLMRPVWKVLQGYIVFTKNNPVIRAAYPILRLLGTRLTIPISPLAPLLSSPSPHPLLLFSHGLAGTQTAYSRLCAAWASEGYVVLAVEHRDGSGPWVACGEGVELGYVNIDDVDWPQGKPERMAMRAMQLDVRVSEIYETLLSFSSLTTTGPPPSLTVSLVDGPPQSSSSSPAPSTQEFLESWKGRVEVDGVMLTGHSFGGATVFHLLAGGGKGEGVPEGMKVKGALALDPWCEPLAGAVKAGKEAEVGEAGEAEDVPMLVINSEGFTVWDDHFGKVVELVRRAGGALMTIVGCDHQSFSDFPLLVTPAPATALLTTIHALTLSFLRGALAASPLLAGKAADDGMVKVKEGRDKKGKVRMEGELGEVVVHLVSGTGGG